MSKEKDQSADPKSGLALQQALVVIAIAGIAALAFAEISVRLLLPNPAHFLGHPANVPGLVTQHELRGYTWTPGFEGEMVAEDFTNPYVISSQGFRDEIVEDDGRFRILAIGDSFTGGEGVNADETWPKQLEVLLIEGGSSERSVRVINAGVTGYGAHQMRQMAEEAVPKYQPDMVIMGLFAQGYDRVEDSFALVGTHLVREKVVPDMRLLDNGNIWWHQSEFEGEYARQFEFWCQNYWHFGAYLIKAFHRLRRSGADTTIMTEAEIPASDRLKPVFEEIELLSRYLSRRDIPLTILVINRQGRNGTFSADKKRLGSAIREFGAAAGIPVVDPTDVLDKQAAGDLMFRFANDGHWTPLAHRVAAETIATALELPGERITAPTPD